MKLKYRILRNGHHYLVFDKTNKPFFRRSIQTRHHKSNEKKITSIAAHRLIPWKLLRDPDILKCHLSDSLFLGRSLTCLKWKLNAIRLESVARKTEIISALITFQSFLRD